MSDVIRTTTLIRTWNSFLDKLANLLFNFILVRPTKSILLPCILSLIIAYPTIYNFYINSNDFFYSLLDNSKLIKYVDFSNNLSDYESLILNVFSFEYDSNLLNKDFMLQFHDIQSMLFANVTDNLIYSPLDYWNNDKLRILYDNNILKTIQLNAMSTKNYSPLKNLQLFANIVKSDGLIISANVLRILSYSSTVNNFTSNIDSLIFKYPSLKITSTTLPLSQDLNLSITSKSCTSLETYYIYLIIPLLLVFSIFRLNSNKVIKSKVGIFLAFFVQLVLTSLASMSIISFIYGDTYHQILELPIPLLLIIPFIVNTINIAILVHSFLKFSTELSFVTRIHKIIKHTFPVTTHWNLLALIILFISYLNTTAKNSSIFTVFTLSSIILNYLLIITYFSAVIVIDFNNVELQDLIQSSKYSVIANEMNRNIPEQSNDSTPEDNNNNNKLNNIQPENNFFKIVYNFIVSKCFVFLISMLLISIRLAYQWTEGITYHLINNVNNDVLDIFVSKRGFAYELSKLSTNNISLQILSPILFSNYNNGNSEKLANAVISSTFDSFYFFEFISFLIFTVSSSMLVLKLTINYEFKNFHMSDSKLANNKLINSKNSSLSSSLSLPLFNSKDLVNGHVLDIVKLCTSQCPFIVSVGIDHKILVWSPLKVPIPIPTQLPIGTKFLPITHIEMSDSGSLITVFSRSGEIKCWSRYSMSWIWSVSFEELVNDTPLVTFFRKRTQISTGRRKLVSRSSKTLKERGSTKAKIPSKLSNVIAAPEPTIIRGIDPTTITPMIAPKPSQLPPKINKQLLPPSPSESPSPSSTPLQMKPRLNLKIDTKVEEPMKQGRRTSLDSNFDQAKSHEETTDIEFSIVLKNGNIISIDCVNGNTERTVLTSSTLLCAKKLVSPRVNDRLVGIKDNGELIVSTVVNNKWKSRPVKIDTSNYNTGKSLITPAILMKYQEFNYSTPNSPATSMSSPSQIYFDYESAHNAVTAANNINNENENKKVDFNDDLEGLVMETVPFVGMIVRAFGSNCQLIDVQTGISLKEWQIGKFKPNTFKVFHSEPSHCRFCGCVSVESFSVAYTENKTNSLIMHTFSIDNRAKNNICLRVERDSRETRCLGFASVTEHQHILSNVEEWCSTDMNILIGIRKKEINDELITINGMSNNDSNGPGLRKRISVVKKNKSSNKVDDKKIEGRRLSDIWEGWTMSADGQIRCYQIPNGLDSGLLIKKLGPVCKFGHKSIVVSFGNIMKVLYLGNDNLIEEGEPNDENISSSPMYQSSSSLSFINRRRKMRMKKYDLTHSTNFEDATPESVSSLS